MEIALASKDCIAFFFIELLPATRLETPEWEGTDSLTNEAECWETNRGCHSTHLTIFPLTQLQAEPGIDDFLTNPDRRVSLPDEIWLLFQRARGMAGTCGL